MEETIPIKEGLLISEGIKQWIKWEISRFYNLDQAIKDPKSAKRSNTDSFSSSEESDSEDSASDSESMVDNSKSFQRSDKSRSRSRGNKKAITPRPPFTSYEQELNAVRMDIDEEPTVPRTKIYRFKHQTNNLYSAQTRRKLEPNRIVRWSNKSFQRKRVNEAVGNAKSRNTNMSVNISVRTGSLTTIKADFYSPKLCIGLLLINYENLSYYTTAILRIRSDSDYVGIITASNHLVKKTKNSEGKMTLTYPKSITLFIQSGEEEFQEYELKVQNFKVHPKFIKQFYSPHAYRIAVAVADLNEAYPLIEDIDDFKDRLMSGMPKLARKYKHKKNDRFKMIWYPYSDIKQEHETDGLIHKVVKEDKSSGTIMYKDIFTTERQAGAPILKYHEKYGWHIIGVHVGEMLGKVECGVIVTKTIKKWIENNILKLSKGVKRCSRFGKQIDTDIDTVKL